MEEKCFIPINELPKLIKQGLEFDKDFKIDRKTVLNIINLLHSESLVDLTEFKVTFNYIGKN